MLIINISITQALIVLIAFYKAMKDKLENFDPFPKFICIKAIIIFAFWQVSPADRKYVFLIIVCREFSLAVLSTSVW